MNTKEKHYSTDDLTVIWKPDLCIHAGECVKRLPKVYDPNARPWVTPDNASTEQLVEQIKACPSGALTYKLQNEVEIKGENAIKVEVIKGGPLRVHGDLTVTDAEGKTIDRKKITGFCRCGASANKPFCDGAHRNINWDC